MSELPPSPPPVPTVPVGILLDIEGTTSSVSFVYDEMFPFVRRELKSFLASQWDRPDVRDACERIARDANWNSLEEWTDAESNVTTATLVANEVLRLMDDDVKATGLKQLQGLIWQRGFQSGELVAHVYDEVPGCLRRWCADGHDVRIYSSGSVHAQQLFFGHTSAGNLLGCFRGHYDTTIGSKRQPASYAAIAADFDIAPGEILFLSDVPAELDAAQLAGMQTVLVRRPGNDAALGESQHASITRFTELE